MMPLARAKVGQWARYKMAGQFMERIEVVRVTETDVHLKVEMWLNGRPAGQPATRVEPIETDWALRAALQNKADVNSSQTTLTVAGRSWPTRLTTARWHYEGAAYERRTWTSSEGPIYGVIRMIMTVDDTLAASMELVEFGDASVRTP